MATDEKVQDSNDVSSFLTGSEMEERRFDLKKVLEASLIRETPHPQFDDMSYLKWNETNEKADMSYMPARKNKYDSRITSGITREKDNTILSMATGFNYEGTVRIFYRNRELYDLSTLMTQWVRKTREDELYDEKRRIIYRNGIVQGTAFVREKFVERMIPAKEILDSQIDFAALDKLRWKNRGKMKVVAGAESNLVDGKKVFLEDIRQQDIRKQPGITTIEFIPRAELETVMGRNSRWGEVPKQFTGAGLGLGQLTVGTIYSDWIFAPLDLEKCCVMEVFRQFDNRYQLYVNGVPMLPEKFPLTAVSPTGWAPFAKLDIEPMNLFAYSKGIPAKTKVDQAVYDMILKITLIKAQQGAFPPKVNNTGKVLSSRVFMPYAISQGFNAEKLQDILKDTGVSPNDFNLLKLLSDQISEKSIDKILEGSVTGAKTLGEYQMQMKAALTKIGSVFSGIVYFERQLLELRFANLLANGARKQQGRWNNASWGEVSFDGEFDDGTSGTQVIRFQQGERPSPEAIFAEEIEVERETGQDTRIAYIDPVLMRSMLTDPEYTFLFEVTPVDKNNDSLTKAQFVATITQAGQIFGYQSMAVDRLKRRYASVMGEQYDDLFISEAVLKQQQQAAMMQQEMQPPEQQPNQQQIQSPIDGKHLAVDRMFQ